MTSTTQTRNIKTVSVPRNYEHVAWKWMRYSGVLLIPLVWIHMIWKDVVLGVHAIDVNHVAEVWAYTGWRVYDAALLGFAFAHGMNGVRQVLFEYFQAPNVRKILGWVLFFLWFAITAIGAIAIVGGVRLPEG
jgi:succinate dehydrogenase / fumarate reductase, membrane anchor subunit